MKLIIFCPYYPPHIGGLELHADEFNEYLSRKGIDITVFAPRLPKEAMEYEIRHNNVKIIRFPAFEIIPNYPLPKFWNLRFWKLFFSLFKERFDITISRTRFFNTSLLALIYSKIKKIKWIHIEHGSDFVSLSNTLFSKIARLYDHTFGKLILKSSDYNISNSIASANFCRKLVPQKYCEVIYRGVEIEKISEIKPDEDLKNKYPGSIIITFIGRLIDGKGVSDLIKSISKIKNSSIKCFIIGDGPQKENLKKLADNLGVIDKIIFFGYKSQEKAIEILKISDIFVNPSHTEGLPSSVIEAALCQKPIIATNVGGTPEIINVKNGFLIEPKNADILKEKLEILLNDAELRNVLGENNFEEVKNKFDWGENILKYLDAFKKISDFPKKKIYILSSRHGGPYKQHKIISEEFRKNGFWVDHRSDLWGWIKFHFIYGKNKIIITNVPFLFRFTSKNFFLNIKGNYKKERGFLKNQLGYFYRINMWWSKIIIVPSTYLKEVLALKDVLVIPNAISLILSSNNKKSKEMSEKKDEIFLIMITKFYFRKKAEGVLKVINCLSKIKTNRKINLNIFGVGNLEKEIREKAIRIILPNNVKVTFKGFSSNIYEEYAKSDIFVYWSNLDVMPNVFLEAMTCGLPIVTNNFPSFSSIIGNHNLIAENEEQFILYLKNLVENERLIHQIGEKNREFIRRYNIENIIHDWINLLQ